MSLRGLYRRARFRAHCDPSTWGAEANLDSIRRPASLLNRQHSHWLKVGRLCRFLCTSLVPTKSQALS